MAWTPWTRTRLHMGKLKPEKGFFFYGKNLIDIPQNSFAFQRAPAQSSSSAALPAVYRSCREAAGKVRPNNIRSNFCDEAQSADGAVRFSSLFCYISSESSL